MNKKNVPLYIALAIPVFMVILVACFIYIPGIGKHPEYNFVYETGNFSYDTSLYQVRNNQVVPVNPAFKLQPPAGSNSRYGLQSALPDFYEYNVRTNTAEQLSLTQIQQLSVNGLRTSPDGYAVVQGSANSDFLGIYNPVNYTNWYLQGHNRSWKLNLQLDTGEYYNNFQFLGWVK